MNPDILIGVDESTDSVVAQIEVSERSAEIEHVRQSETNSRYCVSGKGADSVFQLVEIKDSHVVAKCDTVLEWVRASDIAYELTSR